MKIKVTQGKKNGSSLGGNGLQKRAPVLKRLSEFDNIYERRCCESSFLFYHYSKKHQKQRVFGYLVIENKSGAATF